MDVSWVVQAGAIELAVGALSGWIVTLSVEKPDALKRIGVRAPRRLLQAHLDYIVMGVILIALGLAAPGLDPIWQVLLVAGAWVNATLFLPLAWSQDFQEKLLYKVVSVMSFVAVSAGTVAAAVYLLKG